MASAFDEAVWELVRQVPAGRATTYGQIAEAYYGARKGARGVGGALARCPDDVPWWRVVQADGAMKAASGGGEQRARLREEDVALTLEGRVDWALTGPWSPVQRHGLAAE